MKVKVFSIALLAMFVLAVAFIMNSRQVEASKASAKPCSKTEPVNMPGASVLIDFYLEGGEFSKVFLSTIKTTEQPSKYLSATKEKRFPVNGKESASLLQSDQGFTEAEVRSTLKAKVTLLFTARNAKKLIKSATGWTTHTWERTEAIELTVKEKKAGKLELLIDPAKGTIIKVQEVKKK